MIAVLVVRSNMSSGLSGSSSSSVVVAAAAQCSLLLSLHRSLSVSCHSRAPVAVVDASPHPDHAVHAGIVRCCHLHAAGTAETADYLD